MNYLLTDKKELVQAGGGFFEEITCTVGTTYYIDGIQVVCIKAGNAYAIDNIYLIDLPHSGDVPIFVDKNHDLSFYCSGSDFLNTSEGSTVISNAVKYGYEWGGYQTATGVTATDIGTGLGNTNALIGMNLQPRTSSWNVVWDKVQDFRSSYGHNWFVPSKDELNLVYQQKANLTNITDSDNKSNNYYWSSSEDSSNSAWYQYFKQGSQSSSSKYIHSNRVRLCRQL